MKIQPNFIPIKYYGYEKAYADNIFITFERTSEWNEVQDYLHKAHDLGMVDNKVTFEVKQHYNLDGPSLFIMFKDFAVHIGTSIRPYRGTVLGQHKEIKSTQK